MYIDKELEFSNEQAVTASAASTNYVDKGLGDAGLSERKHIAVTVDETPDSADDTATIVMSLEQDDNTSFSSADTVIQSKSYAIGDLSAGDQVFLPIPIGTDEQYIRMKYTIGTQNLTAGKFTAQIVDKPQKNVIYANAID